MSRNTSAIRGGLGAGAFFRGNVAKAVAAAVAVSA